jgi:hypothetical protein
VGAGGVRPGLSASGPLAAVAGKGTLPAIAPGS